MKEAAGLKSELEIQEVDADWCIRRFKLKTIFGSVEIGSFGTTCKGDK
jgi:hypothetical protein